MNFQLSQRVRGARGSRSIEFERAEKLVELLLRERPVGDHDGLVRMPAARGEPCDDRLARAIAAGGGPRDTQLDPVHRAAGRERHRHRCRPRRACEVARQPGAQEVERRAARVVTVVRQRQRADREHRAVDVRGLHPHRHRRAADRHRLLLDGRLRRQVDRIAGIVVQRAPVERWRARGQRGAHACERGEVSQRAKKGAQRIDDFLRHGVDRGQAKPALSAEPDNRNAWPPPVRAPHSR